MQQRTTDGYKWLVFAGIILFFVSYLSHLGSLPIEVRTDEGRRALVSTEMILSGNYLTPTLNGELFLNKPPLYNWLMIASMKLGGSFDPFWLRLPVFFAIAFVGVLIYFFVKKYINPFVAVVTAFAFITNGRILIYDSLQSFIDISFGCCMYWLMMLVYHYGKQNKYWQLFLFSYLLAAAGFLMKGLPALVFEGITLLVYFSYTRRFKILFSIQHIVGVLLLAAILGSYYYAYFTVNNLSPIILFTRLITESTDRTVVKFGVWETVWHFIYFPFEMLYHYAPWLLLTVVFFQKNLFKKINADPFVQYNWWIFLANFIIYWTSPQVYARYLFPLLPMLLTVLFYLFYKTLENKNWQRKIPEIIFGAVLIICTAALFILPFIKAASAPVQHPFLKAFSCGLLLATFTWLYFFKQPLRLLILALGLFTIRLAFNWFVIDQRGEYLRQMEAMANRITTTSKQQPLYLQQGAQIGNFDGMSFYISSRRKEVLKFDSSYNKTAFYITDSTHLVGKDYQQFLDFDNPYADHLYLVKFK